MRRFKGHKYLVLKPYADESVKGFTWYDRGGALY